MAGWRCIIRARWAYQLRRKNGKQEAEPIHPELEEPLKDILTPTA